MLVVFMLLLMTIGVLFMVRPGVIDNRRAAKEAEIIAMIEASGGSVEIPDMQLPEVQGEEDETFEGYEPGFEQDMGSIPGYEPEEGAEESKSVGCGTISIPAPCGAARAGCPHRLRWVRRETASYSATG